MGTTVSIDTGGARVEGVAQGVESDGALRVRTRKGIVPVAAGEVL
jgi:biotin-(acetyl-CoA carboxylase) ligase